MYKLVFRRYQLSDNRSNATESLCKIIFCLEPGTCFGGFNFFVYFCIYEKAVDGPLGPKHVAHWKQNVAL